MTIKELFITDIEEKADCYLLTKKSGDTVIMTKEEYKSMITSGLDEMKDDMFPELHNEE